jgi:hypothetical protein
MSDDVVMRVRSKSFTWPNLPPRPKLGPGEKYHPRPHGADEEIGSEEWQMLPNQSPVQHEPGTDEFNTPLLFPWETPSQVADI